MKDSIEIFTTENGIELAVKFKEETVWATQKQISVLFSTTPQNITMHLRKIYKEEEIEEKSTCKQFLQVRQEGKRQIKRQQLFYNLDAVISVGYRINSKAGTKFRQWATLRLKDYLVKGYVVNEKRLKEKVEQLEELKKVVQLQDKVISNYQLEGGEAAGLIKVITDYALALDILDDYDHQRLKLPKSTSKEVFKIGYAEAKKAIDTLGKQTNFQGLFGLEKDDSFKGSLENIYQTFDGKDLYPSIEEKAAHLLYFVTKNHSFTDGNKRIAAFLFIWFLEKNQLLIKEDGQKRIPDNALVALTLLIAESDPQDKDMMIKVIVNLLTGKKHD